MCGTGDAMRGHILPVSKDAAIAHGEPAIVAGAHHASFMTNTALLALKTRGLPRTKLAGAHGVSDASLLVEFALANDLMLRRRRGCLGKGDGGRCCKGRHKDIFEESHGFFSFCDGGG
jgi:hypothetical protein